LTLGRVYTNIKVSNQLTNRRYQIDNNRTAKHQLKIALSKTGFGKNHEDCYPQNNVCNEECEEIRKQLDSKFAAMNKK